MTHSPGSICRCEASAIDPRSFPTATCPIMHGSQHRVQLPHESTVVQSAPSRHAHFCGAAGNRQRKKHRFLFSTRTPLTEVMTKGGPPGVSLIPRAYKSPTSVTVIALTLPAAPLRPPKLSSESQSPTKCRSIPPGRSSTRSTESRVGDF